jgi:putative DNA primase/helicase
MEKIIQEFIEAMTSHGIYPSNPSDIRADNKRRDFHIAGDAKSKKKGFYKLKIDGDFGFGFYGDWRVGDCHSWHSKADRKFTADERKAFAARVKAEKERQEAEQKALWDDAATRAQEFMLFLSDCTQHAYLTKKGVASYGNAYLSGSDLIIPMADAEKIWNYQRITEAGDKRFLKDAKKQGTWFAIPGSPEAICLCEGYATGASIHEATGFTVIVAFDAGNMVSVAPKIKVLNPGMQFIVCADNDHETLDKRTGEKRNTGIIKAIEASKILECPIAYPEFSTNDTGLSDFNDTHQKYGLAAVRKRILAALDGGEDGEAGEGGSSFEETICDAPPADSRDDNSSLVAEYEWQSQLQTNEKGDINPRSTLNLLLFLENHEFLKGVFRYDSFSKDVLVCKCPPWEDERTFVVRSVADFDYIRLEAYLEGFFGLKASKDKCADAIISVANTPENVFNPAADYFNSLVWDGKDRLSGWLKSYVSDSNQPDEYLRLVGEKFLCGLAARAMEPGVKFDTMLILEGRQYAGKSFLSRVLGTINGVEYFLDDFKEIDNKDALMKIQGKLVVEFPEISTMRRAEVNDLKAFLSRTHDVFRPPYGRNAIEAGRQCVFIGTVNPEGPYLRDVTGNRRYWPVSCRDKIDIDSLNAIVPQLHAQAAHIVKRGESRLWLDDAEYEICAAEQEKRVMDDIWSDRIETIINGQKQIATSDILVGLNISIDKATPLFYSRINQTMIALGFAPDRVTIGSRRLRGYIKKGAEKQKDLLEFEEEIKW